MRKEIEANEKQLDDALPRDRSSIGIGSHHRHREHRGNIVNIKVTVSTLANDHPDITTVLLQVGEACRCRRNGTKFSRNDDDHVPRA